VDCGEQVIGYREDEAASVRYPREGEEGERAKGDPLGRRHKSPTLTFFPEKRWSAHGEGMGDSLKKSAVSYTKTTRSCGRSREKFNFFRGRETQEKRRRHRAQNPLPERTYGLARDLCEQVTTRGEDDPEETFGGREELKA